MIDFPGDEMDRRLLAHGTARSQPLLDRLARRFDLRLDRCPAAHLVEVAAHYRAKRAARGVRAVGGEGVMGWIDDERSRRLPVRP